MSNNDDDAVSTQSSNNTPPPPDQEQEQVRIIRRRRVVITPSPPSSSSSSSATSGFPNTTEAQPQINPDDISSVMSIDNNKADKDEDGSSNNPHNTEENAPNPEVGAAAAAAVVVMRTPRGDTPIPPAPTKPDGTLYHFYMRYSGHKYTAYSDDTGQLLNILITDYFLPLSKTTTSPSKVFQTSQSETDQHPQSPQAAGVEDDDEAEVEEDKEILRKLTLRILYAVDCQVKLQSMVIMEYEGFEGCTPEEIIVLEGPRDKPPIMEFWDAPVPLVLVTTYYEPYTQTPRPRSRIRGTDTVDDVNIIWLDPATEMSLLMTLATSGFISLSKVRNSPLADGSGNNKISSYANGNNNDDSIDSDNSGNSNNDGGDGGDSAADQDE